jgi:type VI secretion system protein ImpK
MSNEDDPFKQNRGQKTVFIPNPGGRRAAPATNAPVAPPPGSAARMPPPAPGAGPVNEDWIESQPQPRYSEQPDRGVIPIEELVVQNENPIMQAAGPLLLLLGRLRVAVLQAPFAVLMEQVAEAIVYFDKAIRLAGVSAEQANTAKYILCATADDIVQNIPTDDRHVWTHYSMLSRFFGERIGGVRFFEELDRAKMDPINNYTVLELMYAALALGFQGVNRTSANGQANLQRIQRDLYEILRRVRPRVDRELSPHWQGQALPHDVSRLRIPVWAVMGVAALGLFGLFITLRVLLSQGAEVAAAELAQLHGQGEMKIEHRVFAAPPPVPVPHPPPEPAKLTQLQRIRAALAPEISAGKVDASQTATKIVITVGDLVLFPSGQATVKRDFEPIAKRIGETLEKEPGTISIIGHTDNVKLNVASRFTSNWQLSMERAKAVVNMLKPALSQPERLTADGRGDEAPVAPNTTPEGRAKNRRVELMLARTGE